MPEKNGVSVILGNVLVVPELLPDVEDDPLVILVTKKSSAPTFIADFENSFLVVQCGNAWAGQNLQITLGFQKTQHRLETLVGK